MSAKPASRRAFLVFLLLLGLVCAVVTVSVVFAGVSPAAASLLRSALPTATPPARFMLADIPKPTYTPQPTILPSPTPSPVSSPAPLDATGVIEMSIVETSSLPAALPNAAPSYAGDKYILVDISEQHMYVYENGQLIYSFVASTGINNGTRTGLFHVQSKIPNAYGATWNIWMPNWLGIYWAGGLENGIHALPILPNGAQLWEGYLGRPVSYGCVVLGAYEASLLYDWAEIGTPVEIRW